MTDLRFLVLLVAVDCASKLVALALLPEGHLVDHSAIFQFVLDRNEMGIGTWGKAAMRYSSPDRAVAGAFGYVGLTVGLIALRHWRQGRWRKVAVCVAAFALPAAIGMVVASSLANLPHSVNIVVLRGAGVLFTVAVWWLVPKGLWKFALTLLAAGALGNFLSLLYPPFQIVDFMYSSVAALTLRYGVFNVADLYIPVGWACLAIAAGRGIVRLFRDSHGDHSHAPETVV